MDEAFLHSKLDQRKARQSFRSLQPDAGVDFCSNDYLGIASQGLVSIEKQPEGKWHGSTGSRLISGNSDLVENTERAIAAFHHAEAALIFNSGYDANVGLLSCVPQRNDVVIYDQLCHASIRDGIKLSLSRAFSFAHNDIGDLEKKLRGLPGRKFVITESVFSMDGDFAPLPEIADVCTRHEALLVVDEAHATGVVGEQGEGLVQHLGLADKCFARMHTFGKAVGCHGAAIIGSAVLRDFLINYSRAFIYTTALPASSIRAIAAGYALFPGMQQERRHLATLISLFREKALGLHLTESHSPVQAVIVPGNQRVREMAHSLQAQGLDVRPILSPTVPEGTERLRIVLHAFNSAEDVSRLVNALLADIQKE